MHVVKILRKFKIQRHLLGRIQQLLPKVFSNKNYFFAIAIDIIYLKIIFTNIVQVDLDQFVNRHVPNGDVCSLQRLMYEQGSFVTELIFFVDIIVCIVKSL